MRWDWMGIARGIRQEEESVYREEEKKKETVTDLQG